MLVKDVMSPRPVTCKPADRLDAVAKLMVQRDCGAIPVVDGKTLAGIVTDRDITCRGAATGKTPAAVPAGDVMTPEVFTIRENEPVEAAIELMKAKQIRRVLVVNAGGELIGIVSPSDLAPVFASTNVADFLLSVSYWNHGAHHDLTGHADVRPRG